MRWRSPWSAGDRTMRLSSSRSPWMLGGLFWLFAAASPALLRGAENRRSHVEHVNLTTEQTRTLSLGDLKGDEALQLLVSVESAPLGPDDSLVVEFRGGGSDRIVKELHDVDPDMFLNYRAAASGPVAVTLT